MGPLLNIQLLINIIVYILLYTLPERNNWWPIAGYEIYNSLFINSPNSVNLVYIGLFYKASPNNCHTGVVESETELMKIDSLTL